MPKLTAERIIDAGPGGYQAGSISASSVAGRIGTIGSHVLATAEALGAEHRVSGLTAGQVLRASGETTALFAQLAHSDLSGIGANDHHAQAHSYDSTDHTGSLSWSKISKTGSNLNEIATRSHTVLSDIGSYTHAQIDSHINTSDTHVAHSGVDFTAGAGLTGGGTIAASLAFAVGAGLGITVNADDVALTTPGTLTATSTNSSTGSHTHAITSSSTPGAAAYILATDASGGLSLDSGLLHVDPANNRIGVNKTNPSYSFDVTGTGRFTSTIYADDDLTVFDALTVGGASVLSGDLSVGTVLKVNKLGTRVGINCDADQQFDLDVAGPIRGTYLVGKHAIQLDNAVAVMHFDGAQPYNLDFTGSTASHMGVGGTVTGGVIYRPGKFGKAVQVGEATTNLLLDPSFGFGTPTYWPVYGAYTYSATGGLYGNGCMTASTTNPATPTGTSQTTTPLANGTYTASVWIYIDSFTTQGSYTPSLYISAYGGSDVSVQSDKTKIGQWQRLSLTFTVTGGPRNVYISLLCYSACAWRADAVQLEAKAYATPYCDGSLGTGHTWSGTPHASTSTRAAGYLNYPSSLVPASVGTAMAWVYFGAPTSATQVVAHTDGGTGYLRFNRTTDRTLQAGWGTNMANSVDTIPDYTWTHIAVVSDGTTVTGYINGIAKLSLSVGTALSGHTSVYIGHFGGIYNLNGLIDDLVILDYAAPADLIRTIYESDAPVFVASSVFHWRSPARVPIWVDEFGLWAQGVNGNAMLGLYGGDPRNPTGNVSKSWGGVTMYENDLVIGRTTDGGAAIHWDDSENKLRIGVQTAEHIAMTSTALQFMYDTTEMAKLDGSTFTLGNTAGSHVSVTSTSIDIKYGSTSKISLNSSGDASFTGAIHANSGSIAGALTIGASGSITGGTGAFGISASGIRAEMASSSWDTTRAFSLMRSGTVTSGLFGLATSGSTSVALTANTTNISGTPSVAEGNRDASVGIMAAVSGSSYISSIQLKAHHTSFASGMAQLDVISNVADGSHIDLYANKINLDATAYVSTLTGTGNRAVYSTSTGALTNSSSDARMKTNIVYLNDALALVEMLEPVRYQWVDAYKSRLGSQQEIGFIAQQVATCVPEVVGVNPDGMLSVDYARLVVVLTGAVRQLSTRLCKIEGS